MGISEQRHRELIECVNSYIRSNLRATLTVKEIAQALGCDPVELSRLYKDVKGVPIKHAIIEGLKERFLLELSRNGTNSYRLRRELGFSSIRHFYRWTKAVFGETYGSVFARLSPKRDGGELHRKGTQKGYREKGTENEYKK
ncbi:MAG: hypothetical protein HBSIN02_15430 [Bacteroidia bacterium]|nr:MAG: hypothetical protein HBSIN02_15430 [Bacteroidia bacterium]